MIKCKVIKTNISSEEVIKNLEGDTSDIVPNKKYILLKYLKLIDSEKLSSIELKEQGFRPPQHVCKLTENKNKDLIRIIRNEFEICEDLKEDVFQEKVLKKIGQNKLTKKSYLLHEEINTNEIENLENISVTEKEAIVKSRIGHSKLKEHLLNNLKKCQLCNIRKEELLIASHIKPWSKSDSQERLDLNNVLLLCPIHDSLFDKGFISFSDNGEIIISKALREEDIQSLNIDKTLKIALNEKQKKYMKYHRENIFKGI